MKRRSIYQAALTALAIIGLSGTAFGHAGEDHGTAPGAETASSGPITLSAEAIQNLGVQTVEAELAPIQRSLELTGRIQGLPERMAQISPRTEGRITEILVKLGDHVDAGQAVLRFQPLTVGSPVVTVNSPIAGYITRQDSNLGMALTPETVAMEVADYTQVLARAFMFEGPELSLIKPGQSARVRVPAFPDEVFEGKVQRLDVGLEEESRTFEAYVLLDNPGLKLRPNMQPTVVLAIGKAVDGIAVPRRAILGDTGHLFVFVRDGETFERRDIVTGINAGDQIEVLEGVLPGDLVVTQGNYQLQFASSQPKKAELHAETSAPQRALEQAASQARGLPGWAWGLGGFLLGCFTIGFLLRRTA